MRSHTQSHRLHSHSIYQSNVKPMGILPAVGLGLTILILKALVPEIMSHIETTAIAFLTGAEHSAQAASALVASAHSFHLPQP